MYTSLQSACGAVRSDDCCQGSLSSSTRLGFTLVASEPYQSYASGCSSLAPLKIAAFCIILSEMVCLLFPVSHISSDHATPFLDKRNGFLLQKVMDTTRIGAATDAAGDVVRGMIASYLV